MANKNVLVVDDDRLIGWALTRELSAPEMAVHLVVTAEDALQEIRGATPFDFLFLDVHLPDANGLDLLAEITTVAPKTKIVIMSADNAECVRRRALEGGAIQFLEKPFDVSEVHTIIRAASYAPHPTRRQPRYLCRVPLRISVVGYGRNDAEPDLDNMPALLADVGPGGLRLRTEYPLRVGQRICSRPAEQSECYARYIRPGALAEVIWVASAGDEVVAGLRIVQ